MTNRPDQPILGDEPIDSAIIERYWTGEASQEELAMIAAWQERHREESDKLNQLYAGIVAGGWEDLTSAEEDGRIDKLMESVVPASAPRSRRFTGLSAPSRPSGSARRQWALMAGMITLAAIVGLSVGVTTNEKRTQAELDNFSSVYTTGNGERGSIRLPDGSVVTLNVGSRLEVPSNYALGSRTIRLEGEAIFSVLHNDDRPFQVVAGNSVTRVLGTSFVVRHYSTDSTVSVAVRDGKVSVANTVVTASHKAEVNPGGKVTLEEMDPGQFTFEKSVLTLPKLSLAQAVPELSRWYNATIKFGDTAVAKQMIRGEFAAGSIADLSEYLKLMYDMRVVRNGQEITLYQH